MLTDYYDGGAVFFLDDDGVVLVADDFAGLDDGFEQIAPRDAVECG